METTRAFDEIVDFIASVPNTEEILSFCPSKAAQQRVEHLLFKKQAEGLTDLENSEMDRYLMMEHMIIMLKKKAQQNLA